MKNCDKWTTFSSTVTAPGKPSARWSASLRARASAQLPHLFLQVSTTFSTVLLFSLWHLISWELVILASTSPTLPQSRSRHFSIPASFCSPQILPSLSLAPLCRISPFPWLPRDSCSSTPNWHGNLPLFGSSFCLGEWRRTGGSGGQSSSRKIHQTHFEQRLSVILFSVVLLFWQMSNASRATDVHRFYVIVKWM